MVRQSFENVSFSIIATFVLFFKVLHEACGQDLCFLILTNLIQRRSMGGLRTN